MLVLSRTVDQVIRIGDDIRIVVCRVKGQNVRIGVEAPDDLLVIREELLEEGQDMLRRTQQ